VKTALKILDKLSRWMGYVSAAAILIMMLLVTANVCGRYFLNQPITGTPEIACLLMIVIVFPALAWAALEGKHIKVDFVMERFPKRVQVIVDNIMLLGALGIFAVITWRSFPAALHSRDVSSLLSVPQAPFYWIMAVGWALFSISIVVLVVKKIAEAFKK
jgi:TRAP-type C4-dicarboxylate transport system permease small subunit